VGRYSFHVGLFHPLPSAGFYRRFLCVPLFPAVAGLIFANHTLKFPLDKNIVTL
jgi:hypothetical protein